MTCDACIRLIKRRLGKLTGVTDVVIDDTSGTVHISGAEQYTNEVLQNALAGTPYTVI